MDDNRQQPDRRRPARRGGRLAATWRAHGRGLGPLFLIPAFYFIYYLSYWVRFEGPPPDKHFEVFLTTAGLVMLVKALLFWQMRVCESWDRLVTFYDLIVLVQAATLSLVTVALLNRFVLDAPVVPRSIYLLDWGITVVLLGGVRAALRGLRECRWLPFLPSDQIPALIVGTSETAESLLRAIIRTGTNTYRVVGFLDDDETRVGTRIGSAPVLGTLAQACDLAQRYGVREILIADEGLPGVRVRQIVADAQRLGLEVKVLPSYEQIIRGAVHIQPRQVSIDDLLRRDPVALDLESIRRWIDGRTLLVTGSAGSIGSEICRQLLKFAPRRIVLVDRWENGQFFLEQELRRAAAGVQLDVCIADVLDARRMREVFRRFRPEVVFHAAAYKHVPLMEAHPGEAVKNIVQATRQLAEEAVACGVDSFVLISTDKAVNPTSVMGACKRVAEMYVQSLAEASACRFVTVRFGNVLDSAGSVVQVFRQQIAVGGPLTVTDPNMRRYFMTIPEAARLVIQAGAIGRGGHVLVLDMGEPVRVFDLAVDMIRLSGLRLGEDVEIEIVGVRPGEKLFEELHVAGERYLPTAHPKIIVADHKPADGETLAAAVAALEQLAREGGETAGRILAQLRQIVPEYERPAEAADARRAA